MTKEIRDYLNNQGITWVGPDPGSIQEVQQAMAQIGIPTNRTLQDFSIPGTSSNPEVQAAAEIYRAAYQAWRQANLNNPGAQWTEQAQKQYLPQGYTAPKQPNMLLGEWFDQYGNIIPKLETRFNEYNQQLANYRPVTVPTGNPFGFAGPGTPVGSAGGGNQVVPPSPLSTGTPRSTPPTNLAPQLIIPYGQRPMGPGAYGERDMFSKLNMI